MSLLELIVYILGSAVLLLMVGVFLFKIEMAILLFFAAGLSIQYFEKIRLGPFSALDFVGMAIPLLLFLGLLINKKTNTPHEFSKDITVPIYFCLCILIFLTGILFASAFYPKRSPFALSEQIGFAGKFFNGFIVLWVVSAFFKDKSKLNKLLSCMLFCLLVPGAIGFWEIITGSARPHGAGIYPMPWAFFHHPGVIAFGFVVLFPVALFKHSEASDSKSKAFWASVVILMLIFLYFTYRRVVWIGLMAQLLTWLILLHKTKYRLIYAYLGALFFILLEGAQSTFSLEDRLGDIVTFFGHLPEAFTSNRYDFLFTGRWGFFRGNLIYLANQPIMNLIFGNGVGSTAYASWSAARVAGGGHNCYFILLIEFGLICFIMYMLLVLILLWKSFRMLHSSDTFIRQYSKLFISLLVSYMVMGLGTHIFYELTSGIWIFWGLAGGVVALSVNENRTRTAQGEVGSARVYVTRHGAMNLEAVHENRE